MAKHRTDWIPSDQPDATAAQTRMRTGPNRGEVTDATDHVDTSRWLPPVKPKIPEIRIFSRWVSILWMIPIGIVLLVALIAFAQEIRTLPATQRFIERFPGDVNVGVFSGYPAWLVITHYLNLFIILFIMRSGIQILADHPRLYLDRNCTPGKEWFRFNHDVPLDRVWTAKDDSVTLPSWLGIPGLRHSIGLARKWHFLADLLWVTNGIVFYIFLFSTDQWQRLVPSSWDVFPQAISTALQYASLDFPANNAWTRFNGLQQLTYFTTVFIAAPLAILTGLMQAPAISNKLGWIGRTLHRQVARTIHFLVLCWFILFIAAHVTMVFITGVFRNLNHIFAGIDSAGPTGFIVFSIAMVPLIAAWIIASPITLRYARRLQIIARHSYGWMKGIAELWSPTKQYAEEDIASYHWVNGTMPKSEEYNALRRGDFADYQLNVNGLVENPRVFSLDELKAMPKQEQITELFCIQGWSGIAKWGGVPMRHILEIVKPLPEARFAIFYSFADGAEGGRYYDAQTMNNMRDELTLLAYEMNDEFLPVLYGAPLRLRLENELGFKMVKWIESIEFIHDFREVGAGHGGYNEDHEFFGYREPI